MASLTGECDEHHTWRSLYVIRLFPGLGADSNTPLGSLEVRDHDHGQMGIRCASMRTEDPFKSEAKLRALTNKPVSTASSGTGGGA